MTDHKPKWSFNLNQTTILKSEDKVKFVNIDKML